MHKLKVIGCAIASAPLLFIAASTIIGLTGLIWMAGCLGADISKLDEGEHYPPGMS